MEFVMFHDASKNANIFSNKQYWAFQTWIGHSSSKSFRRKGAVSLWTFFRKTDDLTEL